MYSLSYASFPDLSTRDPFLSVTYKICSLTLCFFSSSCLDPCVSSYSYFSASFSVLFFFLLYFYFFKCKILFFCIRIFTESLSVTILLSLFSTSFHLFPSHNSFFHSYPCTCTDIFFRSSITGNIFFFITIISSLIFQGFLHFLQMFSVVLNLPKLIYHIHGLSEHYLLELPLFQKCTTLKMQIDKTKITKYLLYD